jgi:hypothetical protein
MGFRQKYQKNKENKQKRENDSARKENNFLLPAILYIENFRVFCI